MPNILLQSWDAYFRNVNNGATPGHAHAKPPPMATTSNLPQVVYSTPTTTSTNTHEVVNEHLSVQALIRGYQVLCSINIIIYFEF